MGGAGFSSVVTETERSEMGSPFLHLRHSVFSIRSPFAAEALRVETQIPMLT